MTKQIVHSEREFALAIQQSQQPPQVVTGYLRLILNYLYGLEVLAAEKLVEVASVLIEHGLVCLVHLADNLCKELGLGYLAEEKGVYDASVLTTLGLSKDDVDGIRASLGDDMASEIRVLVTRCVEG